MNTRNVPSFGTNCKWSLHLQLRRVVSAISVAVLLAATCLPTRNAIAEVPADLRDWTLSQMPALLELYHHLHTNPELSLAEKETSTRLAKELQDAGATVTTERRRLWRRRRP